MTALVILDETVENLGVPARPRSCASPAAQSVVAKTHTCPAPRRPGARSGAIRRWLSTAKAICREGQSREQRCNQSSGVAKRRRLIRLQALRVALQWPFFVIFFSLDSSAIFKRAFIALLLSLLSCFSSYQWPIGCNDLPALGRGTRYTTYVAGLFYLPPTPRLIVHIIIFFSNLKT